MSARAPTLEAEVLNLHCQTRRTKAALGENVVAAVVVVAGRPPEFAASWPESCERANELAGVLGPIEVAATLRAAAWVNRAAAGGGWNCRTSSRGCGSSVIASLHSAAD